LIEEKSSLGYSSFILVFSPLFILKVVASYEIIVNFGLDKIKHWNY
jgi:hypothetical protein